MNDFEHSLRAWLARVCREAKPPSSVVAFNVGLFETADGFSAYLVGADRYDEEDSEWACDETFSPSERYFPIAAGRFSNWEQVEVAVADAVRAFLQSPEGIGSCLDAAEAVTVGFDEGDLQRVR